MGYGIDKEKLKDAVAKLIGGGFVKFAEKAEDPKSCAVAVDENLEDSGWTGKWTEPIREAVKRVSPNLECVCVKPLPFDGAVWYRVDVA